MIRYLSLAEYLWLAEQVTGIEAAVLSKAARIDLADLALHAPSASFGGEEFYPEVIDKAAVLTCRLAWNHPSPMGTSVLHGRHSPSSSTSTRSSGRRIRLTLTMPSRPCRPWLDARLTSPGSPAGFASGCSCPEIIVAGTRHGGPTRAEQPG